MSVKGVLYDMRGGRLGFMCPACKEVHTVIVGGGFWAFDRNYDAPTFSPSILVQNGHYGHYRGPKNCWCDFEKRTGHTPPYKCSQCHSFVRNGFIQFLSDCSHDMAGKTVPLTPPSLFSCEEL